MIYYAIVLKSEVTNAMMNESRHITQTVSDLRTSTAWPIIGSPKVIMEIDCTNGVPQLFLDYQLYTQESIRQIVADDPSLWP